VRAAARAIDRERGVLSIRLEGVATPLGGAAARERTARFLVERGYVAVDSASAGAIFRRGSLFGSWTALTPLKWLARVEVLFDGEAHALVVLDVNTSGQAVTHAARAFWAEEHEALLSVITGHEPQQLAAAEGRAAAAGMKTLVWSVLGLLAGALVVVLVLLGVRELGYLVSPGVAAMSAVTGGGLLARRAFIALNRRS
jgi:hypothetical protein